MSEKLHGIEQCIFGVMGVQASVLIWDWFVGLRQATIDR